VWAVKAKFINTGAVVHTPNSTMKGAVFMVRGALSRAPCGITPIAFDLFPVLVIVVFHTQV
jgi:hypothetical protein